MLSGRAAQKRRLALLALLATAPHRTASRDKLMGLLWPEKDEDQARHLLSTAAYEIRKELGEGVLVSRGDDLVLDAAAISTDLERFRAALNAGDPERAIALYTGPFLDGFHLGGSSEFDRWMEQERADHARAFRRALEEVAELREARGDRHGAVEAWRRLAAEDRYDGRVALRLIQALTAAGNHAGALQFARVYEALLQEEFGTDPSPEFRAAVDAVRAGEPVFKASEPLPTAGERRGSEVDAVAPEGDAMQAAAPAANPIPPGSEAHLAPLIRSVSGGGALRVAVGTMVLVTIVVAALIQVRSTRPADGPLTIAVLPFTHEHPDDEPYADGLTEAILGVLGMVDGVRVPVWSAVASLRGANARQAAIRLGGDYVLEGSVRRDGRLLRVRAWLSDATGMQVWREVYDRQDQDVFHTQDEIARAVLSALEVRLTPGVVRALEGSTRNVAAYDHFLRGRHAWYRRTPDGFQQALIYFSNAVAEDPAYARAFAGLADTYNLMGAYDYGLMPPDSAFPRARRAATRALALAPRLAEAHAALGQTLFAYDRDWAGADSAFQEAIRLNPRYPEAHHWYSLYLIAAGRPGEALESARQALALDSVSALMHANMARHLYYLGDHEAAAAAFERSLTLDPSLVTAHLGYGLVLLELGRAEEAIVRFAQIVDRAAQPSAVTLALLGNAYGRAGRQAEARAVLARLEALGQAGGFVPPEYPALIHMALGDADAAVAGLEAAMRARSAAITFMMVDPLTAPVRSHPGFLRLAREAGLPGEI